MFPRKKEQRVRQAILRGVYEENLRIIRKQPYVISGKKFFFPKETLLFLSVAMLVILGHWDYLTISLFPEGEVTAIPSTQKASLQPFKKSFIPSDYSANPIDYRAFLSFPEISLSRTFGLEVKTIMIDPGHGGSDPGSVGKMGTREKDITLDIAIRLRERLKKCGHYNVLMTREHDISIPLNRRVELARSSKADLFISIHLNYLPSKPINIIETYYFGPSSDNKILKLVEHENSGSQYGLSDFKEIIEKIGDTLKFQESKELAASIQKNLFLNIKKQDENVQDFGIKRAPFLVLLGVDVPAVLTEVSCLSNREEEMQFSTESYRENIARYLEAGILDYLKKGEVSYEARRR